MRLVSVTHTQRWHAHRQSAGDGPVYQGRFKSFPVQCDDHFLTVARYVERNALRANLVKRAAAWRWCSLWRRNHRGGNDLPALTSWPVDRPRAYQAWLNQPQTDDELLALRTCVKRGAPYGQQPWVQRTAERLELASSLRSLGRPKKTHTDTDQ